MVQNRVTLGSGGFCRNLLVISGLLPKLAGQSVTRLPGRLNHASKQT